MAIPKKPISPTKPQGVSPTVEIEQNDETTNAVDEHPLMVSEPIKPQIVTMDKMTSPEDLLARAIDKGLPVEALEKLMNMAEQWRAARAKESFYESLSKLQADFPVIEKKKIVNNKDGSLRYKYAPLEDIIEQTGKLIKKHGFSYTSKPVVNGEKVKAVCVVHHKDGHSDESEFEVPISKDDFMNAQQHFASALTYAKRYAFCAAFGIMTGDEDDDAQGAGKPGVVTSRNEQKTVPKEMLEEYNALRKDLMNILQDPLFPTNERDAGILFLNKDRQVTEKVILKLRKMTQNAVKILRDAQPKQPEGTNEELSDEDDDIPQGESNGS